MKMDKPKLKLVLIMAGHGDRNNTAGKRSYFKNQKLMDLSKLGVEYCEENCDEAFYEGESNRLIAHELMKLLTFAGIRYKLINPGVKDMSRTERCRIANAEAKKIGAANALVVSIHSDAVDDPSAHGASCYTSPGQTISDMYAEEWYAQALKMWPTETFRKSTGDGDSDKEAKFTVLTDTICPAILVENFFFTNYQDYSTHLKTKEGRRKCAAVMSNTIKSFI